MACIYLEILVNLVPSVRYVMCTRFMPIFWELRVCFTVLLYCAYNVALFHDMAVNIVICVNDDDIVKHVLVYCVCGDPSLLSVSEHLQSGRSGENLMKYKSIYDRNLFHISKYPLPDSSTKREIWCMSNVEVLSESRSLCDVSKLLLGGGEEGNAASHV